MVGKPQVVVVEIRHQSARGKSEALVVGHRLLAEVCRAVNEAHARVSH